MLSSGWNSGGGRWKNARIQRIVKHYKGGQVQPNDTIPKARE